MQDKDGNTTISKSNLKDGKMIMFYRTVNLNKYKDVCKMCIINNEIILPINGTINVWSIIDGEFIYKQIYFEANKTTRIIDIAHLFGNKIALASIHNANSEFMIGVYDYERGCIYESLHIEKLSGSDFDKLNIKSYPQIITCDRKYIGISCPSGKINSFFFFLIFIKKLGKITHIYRLCEII